jgi:hypothetical protein
LALGARDGELLEPSSVTETFSNSIYGFTMAEYNTCCNAIKFKRSQHVTSRALVGNNFGYS